MVTGQLGVAGMTAEARTWFEKQLQSRNVPDFLHEKYGKKVNIPAHGGNRVSIRQFNSLTGGATVLTALTEGTPPAVTNATVSETIISVAILGAYMYGSDVLAKQGIDPQLSEWSAVFSDMMYDARDRYVRGFITAGTNVAYVGGGAVRSSVASGAALGWTDLRTARKILKNANAPAYEGGKYAAIIRAVVMSQLFADSTVVNALQYGGPRGDENDLFKGSITTLLGISFNETSNAVTFSGLAQSAGFVEATLFCGKDGYAVTNFDSMSSEIIFHDIGSSGIVDPLNQAWSLGFKTGVGAGIIDQARVLRYESWSTGS
jgi:N4-gp56 family major capsid protein